MTKGHRVLFLVGATATGKSEWALRLAEKSDARVVNCDSVQLYHGVRIGSGQPSMEDRARAPHELYDYVEAPLEMTAGTYRRDFFALLEKLPPSRLIVTGGTGFYFQAVEKGLFDVPEVNDRLREELEREAETEEGYARLREELEAGDPECFRKIHASDRYRTLRALGILRAGGRRPSELRREMEEAAEKFPYALVKTGLRREPGELKDRIAQRTGVMLRSGLVEETEGLLSRGLEDWAPLSSVGYKETLSFLREGRSLEWLEAEINLRTGQLAKRQKTWFQRDEEVRWFGGEDLESFLEHGLRFFGGERILAP